MELAQLIPGIVGACVGVVGWLGVGLFIQGRQFKRQARNAARAVYFELDVNRLTIMTAREFGRYGGLGRTAFERLLPELATWLDAADLEVVVRAYMAHAGYEQAAAEADLPAAARQAVLEAVATAQDQALAAIRARAFSPAERARLGAPPDDQGVTADGAATRPRVTQEG